MVINQEKKSSKVLKTKQLTVDLFNLNEKYNLGNKITIMLKNTLHVLTIVNITLSRNHWIVYLK
ncbi:hypothetical protein [Metabacillus niabensis]|uniref:hypothetical protein n=1 Tax=Metabacillus niabensis TaxID=324854 RepID=UPI0039A2A1E0